jgi:predicted signal transduction protein with EAL and GGDEF domain
MSKQNFKNHARYIPLWHFITPLLIVAVLTGSIIHLVHSSGHDKYVAAMLVVISFILVILMVYARNFALRAQDRAIRAEENFRHFILTGQPHDSRLRMSQIIALRFASDAEMPALAKRAVEEKLSQKQIKMVIQHWRPDYHRA